MVGTWCRTYYAGGVKEQEESLSVYVFTLSLATIARVCLSWRARYRWNWLSADVLVLMVDWF